MDSSEQQILNWHPETLKMVSKNHTTQHAVIISCNYQPVLSYIIYSLIKSLQIGSSNRNVQVTLINKLHPKHVI